MSATHFLRRGVPAALFTGLVLVACGARGPLDITVIQEVPDAARAARRWTHRSTWWTRRDATDASEEEAAGRDAGALVNCGTCVAQSCGQQLLTCITSTACRTALQCVVTTCLTGGTPDFTCINSCTMGDNTALAQLVGAFTCIIQTCGTQCTSILGGLTGGGGGGGGGWRRHGRRR